MIGVAMIHRADTLASRLGRKTVRRTLHRWSRAAGILVSIALISGCLAIHGSYRRAGDRVKIIEPDDPVIAGWQSTQRRIRFRRTNKASEMVIEFLDGLASEGVEYVSTIQIGAAVEDGGERTRCWSRVVPHDVQRARTRSVITRPSRYDSQGRTVWTTRTVTESVYRCRLQSRPVTRTERVFRPSYSGMGTGRYGTGGYGGGHTETRTVTRYEMQNVCSNESQTRTVSRPEWQWTSQYVPAEWGTISELYATREYSEEPINCEHREHADGDGHVITATVYSKLGGAEPTRRRRRH